MPKVNNGWHLPASYVRYKLRQRPKPPASCGQYGEHITNARKYLADQKCTQIDFHLKGQHGRVKQFWLKSEVEKIAARRATKKQLTISFSSNDRIAKLEQEIEKLRSTILHMDRDA